MLILDATASRPIPVPAKRRNVPAVDAANVTIANFTPSDPNLSAVSVTRVEPTPNLFVKDLRRVSSRDLGVLAVKVDGFKAETSEVKVKEFFTSVKLTGVVGCKVEVEYNQQLRTAVVCYDTPERKPPL